MVPVSSSFPERGAEISDAGYMYTRSDDNIAAGGVVDTTNIDSGNIVAIFDDDPTTYCAVEHDGNYNEDLQVDLLKRYKKAVVQCYYSCVATHASGTTTVTLEHSNDGSSWTTVSTTALSASPGETFTNYSAQITSMRYFRMHVVTTGSSGGGAEGGRLYYLKVSLR